MGVDTNQPVNFLEPSDTNISKAAKAGFKTWLRTGHVLSCGILVLHEHCLECTCRIWCCCYRQVKYSCHEDTFNSYMNPPNEQGPIPILNDNGQKTNLSSHCQDLNPDSFLILLFAWSLNQHSALGFCQPKVKNLLNRPYLGVMSTCLIMHQVINMWEEVV